MTNSFFRITRRRAALVALPLVWLAGACTDRDVAGPRAFPDAATPPPLTVAALECSASVRDGAVTCDDAAPSAGIRGEIIGGQGVNVRLTSSNVTYTAADSLLRFDVTVTNLLPEKLGTPDGATLDSTGIRVLFASSPVVTAGSGDVHVVNADDEGTFTSGNQPYFQYDTTLARNEVSEPRQWQIHVDPGVTTFRFTLYVATPLQPLLVITEVMANPAGAVQDSTGEYVEVYNAGRFPVNMRGMLLNDGTGNAAGPPDTVNVDFIVPSGAYRVLGRSQNTARNGGITVDYLYTHKIGSTSSTLQLSNSAADYFRIRAQTGVTLDSAGYASTSVSARSGFARELTNPALDNSNVDGGNWAAASTSYETSNKGTPGAPNSTSTTLPPPGAPRSVTLLPDSVQLSPGATVQMAVSAKDSLGQATSTSYTWATTNSAVATVSGTGLVTGVAAGQATIIATAANGRADSAHVTVETVDYLNHVEFGVPNDGNAGDEILLTKAQYITSYSRVHGGPNWVAWDLNATHFGGAARCDCFSPDPTLPDSVYHVVTSDYIGSGYSRGHMVMSAQRTASPADNAQTFMMTNILPQLQDMNGGPWEKFEVFNNDLARDSVKELYIVAGGTWSATPATLNGAGKVQIPNTTWKIVVILPRGHTLADVHTVADLRVIAVNMPNASGIQNNGWQMYKTTVDAIEAATGYDFLAALPDDIEAVVEAAIGS